MTSPWLVALMFAPLACGAANSKPAGGGGGDKAPRAQTDETKKKPGGLADGQPADAEEVDPERLADLDAMCAALDHDYKDGTLGDYYADVEPKTEWGTAVMEAGNKADQPARHLEGEVAKIEAGADHPALPACKTLMEYIDDVE